MQEKHLSVVLQFYLLIESTEKTKRILFLKEPLTELLETPETRQSGINECIGFHDQPLYRRKHGKTTLQLFIVSHRNFGEEMDEMVFPLCSLSSLVTSSPKPQKDADVGGEARKMLWVQILFLITSSENQ